MIILGIDPGLSGALALYRPASGALTLFDIPTLEAGKGKSKKRVLDRFALSRLVDDVHGEGFITEAFIEDLGVRQGQSAVSTATTAVNYGFLLGVLTAHFVPVSTVAASTWKKAMKVSEAKDSSIARASELLPRHADKFRGPKGGLLDGRAEAALIAVYGARTLAMKELAA